MHGGGSTLPLEVKKHSPKRKPKQTRLGPFRAFIRLQSLGQKGRPDLRRLGALYREAKREGHQDSEKAEALSSAVNVLAGGVGSTKQTKGAWSVKSKNLLRQRAKQSLETFLAEHARSPVLDKALAVVAQDQKWTTTATAMRLARSLVRLEHAEHRKASQEEEGKLVEWQKLFGASTVEHMQKVLPCLRQQSWLAVPSPGLPILELQDTSTISSATSLCAALSSTQPTAVGHLEGFWSQLHTTIDQPIGPPPADTPKAKSSKCFDAGVCLCNNQGRRLAKLRQSFLTKMKHTFDTATSKAKLVAGDVFARIVAITDDAGEEPPSHCWHISLMYWSPYRPTFMRVKERTQTLSIHKTKLEVEVRL